MDSTTHARSGGSETVGLYAVPEWLRNAGKNGRRVARWGCRRKQSSHHPGGIVSSRFWSASAKLASATVTEARDVYQQVFATSKVRDYSLALRNASGGVTEVLYNASVFRNEAGEVEGVFAAARDITERKQLEEQLLQSQKLEAVGQLAGGVAHDFNNIMGVILGYAELAQSRVPRESPVATQLGHVRAAAERAASLTRQLLAFSRRQFLQPEELNLNDVVVDLSELLRRLVGENINITLQTSDDLGRVKADPIQIQQVLINLAVNARDAMPKGGRLMITTANAELMQRRASCGRPCRSATTSWSLSPIPASAWTNRHALVFSNLSSPPRKWAKARDSAFRSFTGS